MTPVVLSVFQAGPLVTVQDAGRFGRMRFGVPASGPMDRTAFAIANAAVGNPPDAPLIEISTGGLTLDCSAGDVTYAVVGGGFDVRHDAARYGSWSVGAMTAGSRLTIRAGRWGSWTYLALAGQMQCRRWLNSAATHAASDLGGGRLTAGMQVVIDGPQVRAARHGPVPCPVFARPQTEVRVVPGPQDRFFSAATLAAFLGQPFMLTTAYDRMGVRLEGPSLRPEAVLDMPSEPILRGSVQVAGDGVATVLLADHQTTGGYPKIATILSCDVDGFTRLRSRGPVAFRATDPASAVAIVRTRHLAVAAYLNNLRRLNGT